MVATLLASNWPNIAQVRVNAVAPGSSIFSSTAAANYGEELAPFELAKPGVPAKRLGTTFEVVLLLQMRKLLYLLCCFTKYPRIAAPGGFALCITESHRRMSTLHVSPGAARAGVENLSRSLCVEWAGDGVRVNAVAPGVVVSPTARENYAVDVFDSAIPHIPVKRLGVTREVWSDKMSSPKCQF